MMTGSGVQSPWSKVQGPGSGVPDLAVGEEMMTELLLEIERQCEDEPSSASGIRLALCDVRLEAPVEKGGEGGGMRVARVARVVKVVRE